MAECNSTVVTSNISSSGVSPCTSWDSSGLVPAAVMSICFLLGLPGNIAVIILKPNWENMSSLSQSFLLSLAVSDLLCMLAVPLFIYYFFYGWTLGLTFCKLTSYFGYCNINASLLTVTSMSIQRYLQVVYYERSLPLVGAKKVLILLWLVAIIMSIPVLVFRKLTKNQQWTKCDDKYPSDGQRLAVLLMESLVGSVLLSIIIFAYISLYRKVNRAAFFNNPQTTRLITSIIVTLFVLWMPYHAINVLEVAAVSQNNKDLVKFCDDNRNIVGGLRFLQSALNPLLYTFTSNHVSTMCQQLRQKLKIPQICSKSTDITAEAASQ